MNNREVSPSTQWLLAAGRAADYVPPSLSPMSAVPRSPASFPPVSAILPLALLEALQEADAPVPDGLDEYHPELSVKRLGTNRTVTAQIDRFAALVRAGECVAADELIALLRLVARRSDAGVIFSDAGRRAGRYAAGRTGAARGTRRALPAGLGRAVGMRRARQRAARVLGVTLERDGGRYRATMSLPPSAATVADDTCVFFGSAIAELLRHLTDFEGAMLHVRCRARGDEECRWQEDVGGTR